MKKFINQLLKNLVHLLLTKRYTILYVQYFPKNYNSQRRIHSLIANHTIKLFIRFHFIDTISNNRYIPNIYTSLNIFSFISEHTVHLCT